MSNLSRRPSRADALRNERRILDATAETIASEPSASLERVAQRAGVSRATLYAHFPSRDALMDALTERSVDEVTAALTAARPDDDTAAEAMARVLVAAWDTIGRYRGLVIVNQRLDPSDLRARTAAPVAVVRGLIIRGQQSQEFDPELPADWLLTIVVDLIHAASRQVSSGAMSSQAAQRALLRTATAVLNCH